MELFESQIRDGEHKTSTEPVQPSPEDQDKTAAFQNEPQALQEAGKEEGEVSTTEERIIKEVDEYLKQIKEGANLDETSVRARGIQLSQDIGNVLAEIDLEAERVQNPLYRKDGEILLAYKRYAKGKIIKFGRMLKEFFPHLSPRSAQSRIFHAKHPELNPEFGYDRGMRVFRTARKGFPKEKKQMVNKLVEKYDLVRRTEDGETLLEFRKRVDVAIAHVMGVKEPKPPSAQSLVTALLKWRGRGEDLIIRIRSNPEALEVVGQARLDSLEGPLRDLRTPQG